MVVLQFLWQQEQQFQTNIYGHSSKRGGSILHVKCCLKSEAITKNTPP